IQLVVDRLALKSALCNFGRGGSGLRWAGLSRSRGYGRHITCKDRNSVLTLTVAGPVVGTAGSKMLLNLNVVFRTPRHAVAAFAAYEPSLCVDLGTFKSKTIGSARVAVGKDSLRAFRASAAKPKSAYVATMI